MKNVHVVHQTSKVLHFTDLCLPLAINDTDRNALRYKACFFVQKIITFVLRKINKICCH